MKKRRTTKHVTHHHARQKVNYDKVLYYGLLILGVFVVSFFVGKTVLFSNQSTDPPTVEGTNTSGGFDQYGYNYQARIFVGPADGVDRELDGNVWGDPTYAKDHLVMKWSKAWDDARFHQAAWTPEAWVDNEWNGMLQNGSKVSEHVKIIWVGSALENSQYWRAGGYPIWGQFEVIMDQGFDKNSMTHYSNAHATPNGYGGK